MNFDDLLKDKQLNIETSDRDEPHPAPGHSPYEPTPYCVLDRMVERGVFDGVSHLIDLGCGKGRVNFYLAAKLGIRTTGVETEKDLFDIAVQNKAQFVRSDLVHFINSPAENFSIPDDADAFYFFRPFSEDILSRVMQNILTSCNKCPRPAKFIFYYINKSYAACLKSISEISLLQETGCRDLFGSHDKKDKFVVYTLLKSSK